jgi:hypothetical protein
MDQSAATRRDGALTQHFYNETYDRTIHKILHIIVYLIVPRYVSWLDTRGVMVTKCDCADLPCPICYSIVYSVLEMT